MSMSRKTLALAVTAVALAIAAPAVAAGFIRFEGVDGESAAGRANIEVSNVQWGSPLRAEGCSGQSGPGRVTVSGAGLRVATPGKPIPRATLHVRKQGGEPPATYKLENVYVTSATGGSSVSLDFSRVSWSKEGCR